LVFPGVARSSRASAALGINRATAGPTEKAANHFLTPILPSITNNFGGSNDIDFFGVELETCEITIAVLIGGLSV